MVNVTVGYPGVQVIDATSPTNIVSPYGVGILLGTATQGDIRTLFAINSVDDFETEFGNTSPSYKYIVSFFENSTGNVRLYFYRVNPDTGGVPDTPTAAQFVTALDTIDPGFNPGGIIIAPQAFENFNAADRKSVSDAMRDFCDYDTNNSLWFGIVDIAPTANTINNAVSDKQTNLNAPKGQLFTYSPYYYNGDNTLLVPSAAMMGIILDLWSTGRYNDVPAGSEYIIKDADRLGYVVKENERSIAHTNNINLIRFYNGLGYGPGDSLTLSSSVEYLYINSVVCFRIVIYMLSVEMEPYIHDAISGTSTIIVKALATVNRVLQAALDSGYLTREEGRPISDAYTVEIVNPGLPQPGNSVLIINCAVRPAYTLQKVVIYITNTLGVTSNLAA